MWMGVAGCGRPAGTAASGTDGGVGHIRPKAMSIFESTPSSHHQIGLASSSHDRRVMIWDLSKIGKEQTEERVEEVGLGQGVLPRNRA